MGAPSSEETIMSDNDHLESGQISHSSVKSFPEKLTPFHCILLKPFLDDALLKLELLDCVMTSNTEPQKREISALSRVGISAAMEQYGEAGETYSDYADHRNELINRKKLDNIPISAQLKDTNSRIKEANVELDETARRICASLTETPDIDLNLFKQKTERMLLINWMKKLHSRVSDAIERSFLNPSLDDKEEILIPLSDFTWLLDEESEKRERVIMINKTDEECKNRIIELETQITDLKKITSEEEIKYEIEIARLEKACLDEEARFALECEHAQKKLDAQKMEKDRISRTRKLQEEREKEYEAQMQELNKNLLERDSRILSAVYEENKISLQRLRENDDHEEALLEAEVEILTHKMENARMRSEHTRSEQVALEDKLQGAMINKHEISFRRMEEVVKERKRLFASMYIQNTARRFLCRNKNKLDTVSEKSVKKKANKKPKPKI